ncbi:Fanconi anemia group A protein-like [Liolophura sinensis]|uniref:Fanconi anemia group A protein-like n=1 Tax=Liolophura sinensis TaxID=3198878 RepID=UPI0031596C0D
MASRKRRSDSEAKVEAKRRFDFLINSRRSECLSENSKLALQDAVFQLIAHHQDVDGLLAECDDHGRAQTGHKEKGALPDSVDENLSSRNDPSSMTVFSLTSLIRDKSRILNSPVSVVAPNVCAGKLTDMVGKRRVFKTGNETAKRTPGGLTSTDKKQCLIIVKTAEEFVRKDSFNQLHFTKLICKEDYLPLFVTWQLHSSGVMPLDMFLVEYGYSKLLATVCSNLRLIGDFQLPSFKGFSESNEDSSGVRKISVAVLELWLSDIVDSVTHPITEAPDSKKPGMETPVQIQTEVSETNHSFINLLMSSKQLCQSTLKRFSTHLIYHLVKQGSDLKVSEAIQNQHQWTYAKSTRILNISYKTDLLKELLGRAMENCETLQLTGVFLLARQACLEGPHIFPPYRNWFSITFGDSKSPANNRKTFLFLMKFLSDIVPFETSQHLKVHILKPPFVPSKCREVLSDYLTLARTRLADLKDPIDSGGVGDTAAPGTSSDKAQKLENEIEKALAVFDSSGKIPPSIIEASIFRKPYYLGRFLPVLLQPRPLPDIPDRRMKLIEELKRAEKLPVSMYTSYVKACEKEKSQLLEGLYIDDDDSMEDALLQPMDQLKYKLNQLLETLSQSKGESTQTGWKDMLSHVSEKLDVVLAIQGKEAGEVAQTCSFLFSNCPQLTHSNLQVVDALLNTVCRMVVQGGKHLTVLADSLLALVKMLSHHPTIYPALVVRVYKLITEQGLRLESHHIFGITALLVCLGATSDLWPPISVYDKNMSAHDLVQHLSGQLYHHTSQWMMFSLRFCTSYLRHSFCLFSATSVVWGSDTCAFVPKFCTSYLRHSFCLFSTTSVVGGSDTCAFVPKSLVRKFTYLNSRLFPDIEHERWGSGEMLLSGWEVDHPHLLSMDVSQSIFRSKVFQDLLTHCQLSFVDWIRLELNAAAASDCLSETDRYNYYLHMTHDVYIPREVSEGGCGQSYAEACFHLLTSIVHNSSCGVRNLTACPQCLREDLKGFSGHSNREAMLRLLQNLSMFLVNKDCQGEQTVDGDGSSTVTLPWLLQAMRRLTNEIKEGEGQDLQILLQDFFSIALSLTPSLFFTNNLSEVCEGHLQGAGHVINTILKDHMTEGCCLPFHLIAYLLQGLCAVSGCATVRFHVLRLLDRCPTLVSSLLFHWKRLGHITQLFLESCQAGTQTTVVRARTWAIGCFEGIVSGISGQPEWLCGTALVAMALERQCQPQGRIIHQILQICPQVLSPLAECLTHCLTWSHLFANKAQARRRLDQCLLEDTLLQVVAVQPVIISYICSDERESFLTKNLIGPGLNKLKSATLLKLMTKLEKKKMAEIFERFSEAVASSLLRLHVSVGQLYDSMEPSPRSDTSEIYLPINLKDTHLLRSHLMHALEHLTVADLAKLDQALIQTCDPVIRAVISRRQAQR